MGSKCDIAVRMAIFPCFPPFLGQPKAKTGPARRSCDRHTTEFCCLGWAAIYAVAKNYSRVRAMAPGIVDGMPEAGSSPAKYPALRASLAINHFFQIAHIRGHVRVESKIIEHGL